MFTPLVTYETPPTYFATDKVSYGFQCIVDAYGVARCRSSRPPAAITPGRSRNTECWMFPRGV